MISSPHNNILLDAKNERGTLFIQDPIHEALKLRNLLLKPSVIIPMGFKQVSVSHLKMLIDTVTKDSHGLVLTDILPEDKQNFAAFEKIASDRVLASLEQNVIGSEATIFYLKICKQMYSALTDLNMKPLDRIYLIYHSLYYVRGWRKWLQLCESKNMDGTSIKYSLEKNGITANAFTCLEINAYALLCLIVKFRESSNPHLFLPSLFQSQACERSFRQMRSMSTIYWTRINFSLLELLQIVRRIELQNDIAYFKLANMNITLPRIENRINKCKIYELPSDQEIEIILQKARSDALKDLSNFDMQVNVNDIIQCEIKKNQDLEKKMNEIESNTNENINTFGNESMDNDYDENTNESINLHTDESMHSSRFACSSLQDYSNSNPQPEYDSRFIQIFNEDGSSKIILKSQLIWLFSEGKCSLSNDRLRRVQRSNPKISCKRRKMHSNYLQSKRSRSEIFIQLSQEIMIGDWCLFFLKDFDISHCTPNILQIEYSSNVLFGSVLGFRYANGKNEKQKQYHADYALTGVDSENMIEVNASWFKIEDTKLIPIFENNSFYIDMKNYIATISPPSIVSGSHEKAYQMKNLDEIQAKLIDAYSKKLNQI